MTRKAPPLQNDHGSSAGPCLADGPGRCGPRHRCVGRAPGAGTAVRGARSGPGCISATPPTVNLWRVAGAGARSSSLGLLLLLFFYRRRLYILFWTGGWLLVSASMFLAARPIRHEHRAGCCRVRRLAVPRHPERAVLRHQRRRLPVEAPACAAATRSSCSRCCSGSRSRRWRSTLGGVRAGHVLIAGALAAPASAT